MFTANSLFGGLPHAIWWLSYQLRYLLLRYSIVYIPQGESVAFCVPLAPHILQHNSFSELDLWLTTLVDLFCALSSCFSIFLDKTFSSTQHSFGIVFGSLTPGPLMLKQYYHYILVTFGFVESTWWVSLF